MPIYLNASSSLESLAKNLSSKLSASGKSVFEPHYIITQTDGMNNWLKLQIAGHLGIAANCRFLKPNDLIHQLYYMLGGKYGDILSSGNLCWLLYKIMGSKGFTSRYRFVSDYYLKTDNSEARRLGLAQQIADRFDQYQIYRPEMIRKWNERSTNDLNDADWQQYLWVHAQAQCSGKLPDKTKIGAHILKTLKETKEDLFAQVPLQEVHLFGISIITEYHLQILHELSAKADIHFHILNPAPDVYWFDERSERQLSIWAAKGYKATEGMAIGNTLLTGWGKVLQDMFRMMFQYEDFLNGYEEIQAELPQPDTLLRKLQYDIHTASTTDRQPITASDLQDGSVCFSSCYTIVREVEALYNYLVHLVDKRGAVLAPRDIVVMVSNVDKYAPYIKAVFANAPHKFRYTIADESMASGDSIVDALIGLLTITEEGFKAEDVLQLLELSPIRGRFGIADMAHMRRLVNAANIRFGIDGREEDDTRFVSWRQGLRRIMYGICMSGSPEYGDSEDYFYPLDIIEGRNAQDAVRFCQFAERLMDAVQERGGKRTIADWAAYAERLLQNFIAEPEDDIQSEYSTILSILTDYSKVEQWMDDTIPYEVFSRSLSQRLGSTQRSSLYANGGITFCSMIPMRSIPFKVVALLGMGMDIPRRERMPSFDLISREPRLGDRNIKENDKHLFLETILSAKEYLYISYLGRNAKDNGTVPPSILVDELLDYIEGGLVDDELVRESLITEHPLLGFSHLYNKGDEKLYSYTTHAAAEPPIVLKEEAVPFAVITDVDLDDLVRFFHNPFKAYYNKRLGIYYEESEELLADKEIFSLDNLQQWSFKHQLLTLDDAAIEKLRESALRKGELPLRSMAKVTLQQIEQIVQPVREQYIAFTEGGEPQSLTVTLVIDGCTFTGTIHHVFSGKQIYTCWSKKNTKHKMKAYICHLAGVASGLLTETVFLSAEGNEVLKTAAISADAAKKSLAALIHMYKAGHQDILPFCAEIAWEKEEKELEEMGWAEFQKALNSQLDHYKFPCTDPYIMREYRNDYWQEHLLEQYKEVHRAVVSPLKQIFVAS